MWMCLIGASLRRQKRDLKDGIYIFMAIDISLRIKKVNTFILKRKVCYTN